MAQAQQWLDDNFERRPATSGSADFSTAVFHALPPSEEAELVARLQKWNRARSDHGYHAITWPTEYGGLGLTAEHARAFAELEAAYDTPVHHELFSVTTRLIAPTVQTFGTDEQRARFVGAFLRADVLCCQLFSEPSAGSDLAGLATRAVRDGDDWVVTGQKVWSSGAQLAEWGLLIARTDPGVTKHAGMTAFLVPMDTPGVEVRPIKQMSGGASFNEVFLTDARIPDSLRLGPVGDGWRVALTTLSFERDHSEGDSGDQPGGSWAQVLETARRQQRTTDPVVRDRLADLYIRTRAEELTNQRAARARAAGAAPGPEASLGKLSWTERMRRTTEVVSLLLGPSLAADTGVPATYAWSEHVLGAPGYRIAGGSDEIQRNILGEQVLGLPSEPRVDKGIAWQEVPR